MYRHGGSKELKRIADAEEESDKDEMTFGQDRPATAPKK